MSVVMSESNERVNRPSKKNKFRNDGVPKTRSGKEDDGGKTTATGLTV